MYKRVWRRVVPRVFAVLSIVWIVFHYLIVALHVLPRNPVSVLHSELIRSYVEPVFVQRWSLFAPSPPLANDRYLLQVSVRSRSTSLEHLTDWFDVATPLLRRLHKNPLSPATFQYRVLEKVYRASAELEERRRASPAYEFTESDLEDRAALRRLLTVLANRLLSDSRSHDVLAMRARVVREPIPPVSEYDVQRYAGDLTTLTFGWVSPNPDPALHPPSADGS